MDSQMISVVTVSYNVVRDIEQTILSVINQTYGNIEYIIIDGNSTDGTVEIIKKYADKISYCISEPDKGIYDAMNKGIDAASGDYIIFMNSGDKFNDKNSIADIFNNTGLTQDIIYGDSVYRYKNGTRIVKALPSNVMKYKLPFSHQSVFVRTNIMKKTHFDLKYRLASDYDFFLTAYKHNRSFAYLPVIVGDVRIDDGASYQHFYKSKKEVMRIHIEHGYSWFFAAYDNYKETVWYSMKRIAKKIISEKIYNKILLR